MTNTDGSPPDKADVQALFDGMAEISLERRRDFRIDDRADPAKVLYRPSWRTDIPWDELFSGTVEECLLYIEKTCIRTSMCWLGMKFPTAPAVIDRLEARFNEYDPDRDEARRVYQRWLDGPPGQPKPSRPPPLMPRENLRERLREVLEHGLRLFDLSCCK